MAALRLRPEHWLVGAGLAVAWVNAALIWMGI